MASVSDTTGFGEAFGRKSRDFPGAASGEHRGECALHPGPSSSLLQGAFCIPRRRIPGGRGGVREVDQLAVVSWDERWGCGGCGEGGGAGCTTLHEVTCDAERRDG